MKKILLILSLMIFISGCVPGGISPGGIPDAYSDETYTATIEGTKCKLVGATDIGGTLSLADNCVISGTAPSADNTRIIPFKVEITDANGVSKISEMHLTVHPPPVRLQMPEKLEDGIVGEVYPEYSFCNPKATAQCGGTGTINPTSGSPPYTFTISGQPMGLSISLNGVLSGTIPEGATEKTYTLKVCVKDIKGAQDCGETKLSVKEVELCPSPLECQDLCTGTTQEPIDCYFEMCKQAYDTYFACVKQKGSYIQEGVTKEWLEDLEAHFAVGWIQLDKTYVEKEQCDSMNTDTMGGLEQQTMCFVEYNKVFNIANEQIIAGRKRFRSAMKAQD